MATIAALYRFSTSNVDNDLKVVLLFSLTGLLLTLALLSVNPELLAVLGGN
jgi:hypothetical protein